MTKKLEEAAKARRRLPRIEQSIVDAEVCAYMSCHILADDCSSDCFSGYC